MKWEKNANYGRLEKIVRIIFFLLEIYLCTRINVYWLYNIFNIFFLIQECHIPASGAQWEREWEREGGKEMQAYLYFYCKFFNVIILNIYFIANIINPLVIQFWSFVAALMTLVAEENAWKF